MSSFEAVFLRKLDELEAQLAKQSLEKPVARDAFEFGHAPGTLHGINHARLAFLQLLEEKEKDATSTQPRHPYSL